MRWATKIPWPLRWGWRDCYRATGRLQEAEECLRAASQRQPKQADLAAQLALFAWERGDQDQARTLAEAAIQLNADQLIARWVSAELHRVAGRLREAEQGYAWFIDYYNAHDRFEPDELRWIGLASAQYARWKRNSGQFRFLVNTLYPQALKQDENYWPAHLEMAFVVSGEVQRGRCAGTPGCGLGDQPQRGRSARRAGCLGFAGL